MSHRVALPPSMRGGMSSKRAHHRCNFFNNMTKTDREEFFVKRELQNTSKSPSKTDWDMTNSEINWTALYVAITSNATTEWGRRFFFLITPQAPHLSRSELPPQSQLPSFLQKPPHHKQINNLDCSQTMS